jgi:hypothetical protein
VSEGKAERKEARPRARHATVPLMNFMKSYLRQQAN